MAITSYGYPGGFIVASQWAVMAEFLGVQHCVRQATAWQVTAGTGSDRAVNVAAGEGFAAGIYTKSDSTVTLNAASVSSGTRYDTVVARHVWGATNATSYVIVQGGSSIAIAGGLVQNPGTQYDVPLQVIQVNAGSTAVQMVADLRLWAQHSIRAASTNALGSLLAPDHNTSAMLGTSGLLTRYDQPSASWVDVSLPGKVKDPTYGWIPRTISLSTVATISGPVGSDGTVTGETRPQFGVQYQGAEKYAWYPSNGDIGAQPTMRLLGSRLPAAGAIDALTVGFMGARNGSARINILGVYNNALTE